MAASAVLTLRRMEGRTDLSWFSPLSAKVEVGRCLRPAMRSEIGGAGDNDPVYVPDPNRDHGAIGQVSDAHGHVDVIIDEVDVSVREEHPDIDLGERGDEIVHHGKHMQSAENDRCGEREFATWGAVLA